MGTSREDIATLADSIEGILAPPTIKIKTKHISESFLSQKKFLPLEILHCLSAPWGAALELIDSYRVAGKAAKVDTQIVPNGLI